MGSGPPETGADPGAAAGAAERRLEVAEFRELNRIGVNLNQMARVLNFRGGAEAGLGEGKPASGALAVPVPR